MESVYIHIPFCKSICSYFYYCNDSKCISGRYKENELVNIYQEANDGYVFDGWFKDIACTQPVDWTQAITGNVTYYTNGGAVIKNYNGSIGSNKNENQEYFIR